MHLYGKFNFNNVIAFIIVRIEIPLNFKGLDSITCKLYFILRNLCFWLIFHDMKSITQGCNLIYIRPHINTTLNPAHLNHQLY